MNQCIYVSSPHPENNNYELEKCKNLKIKRPDLWNGYDIVEQVIRPTGLVDPEIFIHPIKNQVDHLLSEIEPILERKERVLVTTLTKKMSEDLSSFLDEKGLKVCYLHSEIKALDRIDILHDLRTGKYDILVGVNLLREGLDLPEVSLVAIMDADKEGFYEMSDLLSKLWDMLLEISMEKFLLYADHVTGSMQRAIDETNRRRQIQLAHNKKYNITPKTIVKKISDIRKEDRENIAKIEKEKKHIKPENKDAVIKKTQKDMEHAAKNLQFELAAVLRDQINDIESMN